MKIRYLHEEIPYIINHKQFTRSINEISTRFTNLILLKKIPPIKPNKIIGNQIHREILSLCESFTYPSFFFRI